MLLSSLAGILAGAFLVPTWQIPVETAQVLAGAVEYPPDNPFYWYHLKAWTLLHQAGVLMLWAGLSGWTASVIFSGLMGAVSFASLAMCTYALCRRPVLSLFSPLLVFGLYFCTDQYGIVYEIFMLGSYSTYGVLGRGLALLSLSLLACGWRRTGGFLLGLGPSIHLFWGGWALAAALTAGVLMGLRGHRERLWAIVLPLGLGLGVTVASFAVHYPNLQHIRAVHKAEEQRYVGAYLTNWDHHRKSVQEFRPGMAVSLAAGLLAVAWLVPRRNSRLLAARVSYVLWAMVFSSAMLLSVWFADELYGLLPLSLQTIIFGRIPNLSIYALPAILLGLIGRRPKNHAHALLLALLVVYFLYYLFWLEYLRSDRFGWVLPHWLVLCSIAGGLIVLRFVPSGLRRRWHSPWAGKGTAFFAAAGILMGGAAPFWAPAQAAPEDWEHVPPPPVDAAIIAARKGGGLLVSMSKSNLVQLRTQRPVLINLYGLNQIAYVPESGPAMHRILTTVYGADMFTQPTIPLPYADIAPEEAEPLFEARTLEDWQELREEFGITDVLAHWYFKLDLPVAAGGERYTLYHIPRRGPAQSGATQ